MWGQNQLDILNISNPRFLKSIPSMNPHGLGMDGNVLSWRKVTKVSGYLTEPILLTRSCSSSWVIFPPLTSFHWIKLCLCQAEMAFINLLTRSKATLSSWVKLLLSNKRCYLRDVMRIKILVLFYLSTGSAFIQVDSVAVQTPFMIIKTLPLSIFDLDNSITIGVEKPFNKNQSYQAEVGYESSNRNPWT